MMLLFVLVALFSPLISSLDGVESTNNEMDPVTLEREKLAFVERAIVEIYQRGSFPEVFDARTEFLSSCGCEYAPSPIYWGSKVGIMCKLDAQFYNEECGQRCVSPRRQDILLICPTGWKADCRDGCVPPIFETVSSRTEFLEQNVDSIVLHGFDYLVIDPQYTSTCGCEQDVQAIQYGTKIGFDCTTGTEDQPEDCGGYRGCVDASEKPLIIFCPAGHTPTCSGCHKLLDKSAPAEERYDWMVSVLTGYIRESRDALDLQPRPSQMIDCGCTGGFQAITEYGKRIGFSCIVKDPEAINEHCGPNILCANPSGETILHLCPPAFIPNCIDGCGYAWDAKTEL